MNATDHTHLVRAVDLAETGLELGHDPFGSVLVSADGDVLFEDHNRIGSGDSTRHPEFAIAQWAAANLTPEQRAKATVYTSGEHCPMCAAAHGWVGLGRIVYASSSEQFGQWLGEFGAGPQSVRRLAITDVLVNPDADGPDLTLADRIRELHARRAKDGGYGLTKD
ncbi:nucleoside deaminase [Devosia sp.]|uniref:nucleoside deaminase n=1 Tax=Devosia sp. TaxID=1871048 RepID=UPI003A930712